MVVSYPSSRTLLPGSKLSSRAISWYLRKVRISASASVAPCPSGHSHALYLRHGPRWDWKKAGSIP